MKCSISICGVEYNFDVEREGIYTVGGVNLVLSPHDSNTVKMYLSSTHATFVPSTDMGNWLICSLTGRLYSEEDTKLLGEQGSLVNSMNVCGDVARWYIVISRMENRDGWIVVDGKSYLASRIFDDPSRARPQHADRGMGGVLLKYELLESGEVWYTDDLWHQGELPYFLRKRFPDTARFLKEE